LASCYRRRPSRDTCGVFSAGAIPAKRWLAFLRNQREAIVALDFFTVPTAAFRVLYCFFVIEHGRRRILHFNTTRNPPADWVVQQLREAFPEAAPYRYAVLDGDSIFDADVVAFLKATGLTPKRTRVQAPWQNGIAERWIGSCRREILDHLIALNEDRLRRLIREYVRYTRRIASTIRWARILRIAGSSSQGRPPALL
jgi:transposase InsO family protein